MARGIKCFTLQESNSIIVAMKNGVLKIDKKPIVMRFLNQTRIIVLSFLIVILVGSGLLMLPCSHTESITYLDALFTATSATCVTGLTTIELSAALTPFGQVVVLLLVQIGGMGFMTLASATFVLIGHRFTLRERLNMREYLSGTDMSGLRSLAVSVVKMTAIIEGAGVILLTAAFAFEYSFGTALWYGIFHSVSAFCNAGLDIISGGDSVSLFSGNAFVLVVLALLIVAGGLGFIVVGDVVKTHKWKKLRIDSKIVLSVSGVLLLVGTLVYMIFEYNNPMTLGNMSFGNKLANAFFFSASTRTAGFASFGVGELSPVSRTVTIALMFIGASPASTGGGIKTTTLFVLIVWISAVVRQKKLTVIGMKKVGGEVRSRAATVLVLAITSLLVAQILLMGFDGARFSYEQLLFEAVSAYATVGLSLGITAALSVGGKLTLVMLMFMGRVGAYTLFASTTRKNDDADAGIKYQEFNVMM